jgi:cell wall assembly regulator SMI1
MKAQWESIEQWLGEYAPFLLKNLRPGASSAAFAKLEAQINFQLPDAFRAFYAIHDGQRSQSPQGLFYGLRFMPLAQVCKDQMIWADLVDMNKELAYAMHSQPAGHIKPLYANPLWIPFANDQSGNSLGLDLDPDAQGIPGQVIVFGRDENTKRLVAPSFKRFIHALIEQLEGGNFVINKGEKLLEFAHYPDGTSFEQPSKHPLDVFGRGM